MWGVSSLSRRRTRPNHSSTSCLFFPSVSGLWNEFPGLWAEAPLCPGPHKTRAGGTGPEPGGWKEAQHPPRTPHPKAVPQARGPASSWNPHRRKVTNSCLHVTCDSRRRPPIPLPRESWTRKGNSVHPKAEHWGGSESRGRGLNASSKPSSVRAWGLRGGPERRLDSAINSVL